MIARTQALALSLGVALAAGGDLSRADCPSTPDVGTFAAAGWGLDSGNTRFQPQAAINRANVGALRLAWAFALDGGMSPHSWPVVSADTLFIGTPAGTLFALARDSGCIRWQRTVDGAIRTGIVAGQAAGQAALFFGTADGIAYALDAASGATRWQVDVKDHPQAVLTGTPLFHGGTLYVPVSSFELALAMNPFYGCCTFRGSVVALNAEDGSFKWRTQTIPDEPRVSGRHFIFVEEWGPSGAPVWSAPALDAETGLLYVGTGENYTSPASLTSDAILAMRPADGTLVWSEQFTANDAFNMACTISLEHPNCPDEKGPDYDFGAPPMLTHTPAGEPLLLAGQKSGGVYAMRPATGERVWAQQLGRGGYLGGVHWGMAAHESLGLAYVPISDVPAGPPMGDVPQPGLHALDIATGAVRWSTPNPNRCDGRTGCRQGQSAAIIATEELVFAGALDGHLGAYDAATGALLWSFDTWRSFDSVNGASAIGGAIDVHGPLVVDDTLYIQSGYGSFGQRGGNALLAFRPMKE